MRTGRGQATGGLAAENAQHYILGQGERQHSATFRPISDVEFRKTGLDKEKRQMGTPTDERTAREVMRQWEKLQQVKRALVKEGVVDGNASPQQVLDKIRNLIPADLFT